MEEPILAGWIAQNIGILNEKVLRGVLKRRLEQELQTRQNWGMYPTVDEDIKLRKAETWNQ